MNGPAIRWVFVCLGGLALIVGGSLALPSLRGVAKSSDARTEMHGAKNTNIRQISVSPPSPDTPSLPYLRDYRQWTKVNPNPVHMGIVISQRCASGPETLDPDNPHQRKFATVYVNEKGRAAMQSREHPKFPEGSVIIKEKLPSAESRTPELLTVMVKRPKGFDTVNGDWEYLVVNDPSGSFELRKPFAHCQTCHRARKEQDYVFRTYVGR